MRSDADVAREPLQHGGRCWVHGSLPMSHQAGEPAQLRQNAAYVGHRLLSPGRIGIIRRVVGGAQGEAAQACQRRQGPHAGRLVFPATHVQLHQPL